MKPRIKFRSLKIVLVLFALLSCISFIPHISSAHEVYVLAPDEISQAVHMTSPNPFSVIPSQEKLFLIWGTIIAVSFLLVLTASVTPIFESIFDPFLMKLKKFAPFIGRLTFGVALIYSGYHGAFFGPELPVASVLPPMLAQILSIALIVGGIMICVGLLTRVISLFALVVFAFTIYTYHWYMLTYANYLGEIILFIILGGGMWSFDKHIVFLKRIEDTFSKIGETLEKYSYLILRILFGSAIFFASFYAKFIHSNLALDTVNDYHLTNYFHFTPLFLVLGAFLVEAVIGFCIMTGIEVRMMTLVFTFFLTLSILFFGEAVWPHVILFGVNIVLFFHGYDKYTLEMAVIQRQRKGEPVL